MRLRQLGLVLGLGLLLGLSSVADAAVGPSLVNRSGSVADSEQAPAPQTQTLRLPDSSAQVPTEVTGGNTAEYVLGIGDRIRMTVYGEDELSGEYDIGSAGVASLPLIGEVPAAKQTVRQLEQLIRKRLTDGYLNDPRVTVQVVNYRPFFILGEVSKPGSYPYVNGMTVLNAIALSGGYTYRGDKSGVTILRAADPAKKEVRAAEDATVMPGDIIRVPERFF